MSRELDKSGPDSRYPGRRHYCFEKKCISGNHLDEPAQVGPVANPARPSAYRARHRESDWMWHFGKGIVSTPNDFGRQGQMPSHPELLDWLATEFVERGWSIKELHRLIMLSNTYQQASTFSGENNLKADPENRYLWRMNRLRLEGEELWDSIHSVSGTLNLKMGGHPVAPALADDELSALGDPSKWPVAADPAEKNRRGIYILNRRNFSYPMLQAFDSPDTAVSCPERDVTTVAPQALWLMNNNVAFDQAQEFAGRLVKESGR